MLWLRQRYWKYNKETVVRRCSIIIYNIFIKKVLLKISQNCVWGLQLYKKKNSNIGVFLWNLQNFYICERLLLVFYKKAPLKSFGEFSDKNSWRSFFSSKVSAFKPATLQRKNSVLWFFLGISKYYSKNNFSNMSKRQFQQCWLCS